MWTHRKEELFFHDNQEVGDIFSSQNVLKAEKSRKEKKETHNS
jgi:hypothetical protein